MPPGRIGRVLLALAAALWLVACGGGGDDTSGGAAEPLQDARATLPGSAPQAGLSTAHTRVASGTPVNAPPANVPTPAESAGVPQALPPPVLAADPVGEVAAAPEAALPPAPAFTPPHRAPAPALEAPQESPLLMEVSPADLPPVDLPPAEPPLPDDMLPALDPPPAVPGSGAATVSWTPPGQRVDGSPLPALGGYLILYGTDPESLTQVVELRAPGIHRYMVEGLAAGLWYFGVIALDRDGRASELSALAAKRVD